MKSDIFIPMNILEIGERLDNLILAFKKDGKLEVVRARKDQQGINFHEKGQYIIIDLGLKEFEEYENGTNPINKPPIEEYYFENEEGTEEIFRYKWPY